jgi:hypothetical protein
MENYITLQLLADDGTPIEQECMIIGVFDVDDADYVALAPCDDANTIYIYGYRTVGEEQFELYEIENEETYLKVVSEFNQIIEEE